MDSLNMFVNKSGRKKGAEPQPVGGIIPKGKYYFPSRISSSCFEPSDERERLDRMGIVISSGSNSNESAPKNIRRGRAKNNISPQNKSYETDELYDYPESSQYDPEGWYTGRPENVYEVPVQDADDL